MTEAESRDDVVISISRDPALVRTARLVAAAAARRSGQDDVTVEEVRLVVGEACAVMIGLDPEGAEERVVPDGEQVTVRLSAGEVFRVTVTGRVEDAERSFDGLTLDPWALLRGIDDHLEVRQDDGLTTVSAAWPAA